MNWKTCLSTIAATALLACGGSGGGKSGGGTLTITSTPSVVVADGTSSVVIHVDGSQKGPIVVRTDRGHFLESGALTASAAATPFDVTLVTCNSQTLTGCAGYAQVTASDQNLASGRIQVQFVQAEICNNGIDDNGNSLIDCADPACPPGPTTYCGTAGAPVRKVCTAGTPNFCGCPSANAADCVDCAIAANVGQKCDTGTILAGHKIYGSCKAGGTCSCTPSGTTEASSPTTCSDGIDNDCDGLIDGEDPDCQGKSGQPGQYCGDQVAHPGMTWSDPLATGGVSTCTVCAPQRNFGLAQPIETNCSDGVDNDCNGHADCGDINCVTLQAQCVPGGKTKSDGERCNAAFQCVCPTTGPELNCADGLDNDCDGKIDCADSDCNGKSCGPNGRTCNGGVCTCPGGQAKETTCNDGLDNDCDGLVDCLDPDCQPTTPGGTDGKACISVAGRVGEKCDSLGRCACPGGQTVETSCDDHVDNDCNGLIDCADPSCLSRTCGPNGLTCTSTGLTGCNCPSGSVEICNDKVDNNCDGLVDCQDPGCAAAACDAINPTYHCLLQDTTKAYNATTNPYLCRDASNYAITVTPGVTRLAANGTATTSVVAFLQDVNAHTVVSGGNITFGTTLGTFQGATTPGTTIPATTGVDGKATVTLVASASAGTATVSAQYLYGATGIATGSALVVMPQLSQINPKTTFTIMGAFGSGFQEANDISFQLSDPTNQAYPPGLAVTLTHVSVGGSYIGPDRTACDPVTKLCTVTLFTDSLGQVKITLHSGTQATVTSVTATATGGGNTVSITVGNIAIIGAKASGNEISINCTPKNIPALIDTDCSKSNYNYSDATITCTVSLADRFKNKLGVATLVQVQTEAGAAVSPVSTPAYTTPPPPNLGKAVTTITVTGYGLPADVAPFVGEYSLDHGWDGCGIKTHNPRDGLVTIIAAVAGEEGFVDGSNGCPADGIYNPAGSYPGFPNCLGEYFIDLGEPFVDLNDNGIWDNNEPFVDVNGNHTYDGPNGKWDAQTLIWSETRVLYTGYTQWAQVGPNNVASRFYKSPVPPTPSPQPTFSVLAAQAGPPPVPATSDFIPVYFTDENFNLPTSRTAYATSVPTGAKLTASFGATPPMPQADLLGMNFTAQFCDRPVPTNPTTQCFSSCLFPICYAVTNVGNFGYGAFGGVTITGGASADGATCVYASSTLTTGTVVGKLTLPVCGTSN